MQVAPQREVGEEIRGTRGEAGMQLIRLGALLSGALAHVLHRESGDKDKYLGGAAVLLGLDEHAAEPRIDGQAGELVANAGEARAVVMAPRLPGVDRADFLEQLGAGADGAFIWWIDEGEFRNVTEAERDHLQDDRGQRGALNLRLGELVAVVEILF